MGAAVSKSPRHSALATLAALFLLVGCAEPSSKDGQVSYVSGIGTPFYLALKVPVCLATLVAVGPFSALQGLAAPGERDSLQPDIRPALDAGVAENCGGSPELASY